MSNWEMFVEHVLVSLGLGLVLGIVTGAIYSIFSGFSLQDSIQWGFIIWSAICITAGAPGVVLEMRKNARQ